MTRPFAEHPYLMLSHLLDGLTQKQLSDPLHVAPDPAIDHARDALSKGLGLDRALAEIEAQIRAARQALRGIMFDAVELAVARQGDPLQRLQHVLCTLHVYAGLICRRQGDEGRAHDHWVRAVATGAADLTPRQFLVESYLARGRPFDALSQLESMPTGGQEALNLLLFGRNMRIQSQDEVADRADARAAAADPSGLVGMVIAAARARYPTAPPTAEATEVVFRMAEAAFSQDERAAALGELQGLAGGEPRSIEAWFELGALTQVGARKIEGSVILDAVQELLSSAALDDARIEALKQATTAYEFAWALNRGLGTTPLALATSYALLERWADAFRVLSAFRHAAPSQAAGHALFAVVARLASEHEAADSALEQAKALDSNNPILRVLAEAQYVGARAS